MAVQKQSLPSFTFIISVLSIVLSCVGLIRLELEMKKQTERISALKNAAPEDKPRSADYPGIKLQSAKDIGELVFRKHTT